MILDINLSMHKKGEVSAPTSLNLPPKILTFLRGREDSNPHKKLMEKVSASNQYRLLLFDDNKVRMSRKPGKKQKENLVGCTGKVKDEREIGEECIEDTGALNWSPMMLRKKNSESIKSW